MAFRFCDSFDHYATAQIPLKWTQNFNASIQSAIARNGPNAMFLTTGLANVGQVSKTLDYQSEWTVGWAVYNPLNSSGLAGAGQIYALLTCGNGLTGVQIEADATVSATVGGTRVGNTGSLGFSMHFGTWYYIELQTILSSSGTPAHIWASCQLRVNGVTMIPATSAADTGQAISNQVIQQAQANRHLFAGFIGNSNGLYIDDVYITDNQGSTNTGFLGDVGIFALYPDADASPLAFSIFPTTPTTHYTKVNEAPPDGDTTYIYDNNVGDKDDFDWQPIASFSGTIPAVQYLLYARKDDEGTRTIQHTIANTTFPAGTGGVLGTPEFSLSDDYCYFHIPLDTNPHVGAAWTVANFNAQDFGVLVSS